jgi:hypothetical protein
VHARVAADTEADRLSTTTLSATMKEEVPTPNWLDEVESLL